jgi:hypothetical protein
MSIGGHDGKYFDVGIFFFGGNHLVMGQRKQSDCTRCKTQLGIEFENHKIGINKT